MERKYWLDRKKASIANAEQATNSNARLIQFELAGLYSLKAMTVGKTHLKAGAIDNGSKLSSPSPD